MLTPQTGLALFIGLAAIADDLWRRQIANWIPVTAFLGGCAVQVIDHGWRGLGASLLGTVAGFFVFYIFYWLGGMGGGDVKLMAGFGAVLGWPLLGEAALWVAGCGGLLAVAVIAGNAVRNRWQAWRAHSAGPRPVESIPYAPAIALGVWLSLVPKG